MEHEEYHTFGVLGNTVRGGGAFGTKEAILESNCCFNSSYLQNQEKCHALEINELESAAVCTV